MQALAKMPADRGRTAEEMRSALLGVVAPTGSARGGGEARRAWHVWRLAASVVVGILAIGGLTLLAAGVAMERRGVGPIEAGRRLIDVVNERFA